MYVHGVFGRQRIRISYFNAWPHERYGYNHLANVADKLLVFSNVMRGIEAFQPELCVFGCNTLSILYRASEFVDREPFKVVDVIDGTVKCLAHELSVCPEAMAVVVGTVTTVGSGYYPSLLEKSGIGCDRIVSQGCPYLSTMIEAGPRQREVSEAILRYALEAREKMEGRRPSVLYLALCCTHYGYATLEWRQIFSDVFQAEVRIVNPNELLDYGAVCGAGPFVPDLSFDIYSRVKLLPERIEAMAEIFSSGMPLIVEALRNYHYRPDLFVAPDFLGIANGEHG